MEIGLMIWVSGRDGHLAYICQQWHDLTGQKTGAALGTGWVDALHPDDRVTVVAGFAEACRSRVEFMLRFRLQRADGAHVWVLSAASPSFTPLTHDFVGFLGVLSQYEDDEQNLTATAEIGTFKPGQAQGEFAPRNKLDIAADHLIAARAVTVEYGDEVAATIDNALYALGQALRREKRGTGPPGTHH